MDHASTRISEETRQFLGGEVPDFFCVIADRRSRSLASLFVSLITSGGFALLNFHPEVPVSFQLAFTGMSLILFSFSWYRFLHLRNTSKNWIAMTTSRLVVFRDLTLESYPWAMFNGSVQHYRRRIGLGVKEAFISSRELRRGVSEKGAQVILELEGDQTEWINLSFESHLARYQQHAREARVSRRQNLDSGSVPFPTLAEIENATDELRKGLAGVTIDLVVRGRCKSWEETVAFLKLYSIFLSWGALSLLASRVEMKGKQTALVSGIGFLLVAVIGAGRSLLWRSKMGPWFIVCGRGVYEFTYPFLKRHFWNEISEVSWHEGDGKRGSGTVRLILKNKFRWHTRVMGHTIRTDVIDMIDIPNARIVAQVCTTYLEAGEK